MVQLNRPCQANMNGLFWLAALIAASVPWRNSAVFGLIGRWSKNASTKPLWLTVVESFTLYSVVCVAMFVLESQRGDRSSQAWQFWVIMICLWVVLAFPAAAWFKLRKQ